MPASLKVQSEQHLQAVAVIEGATARQLNPGTGDRAVTADWGVVQTRAVMPGAGKYQRDRTDADGIPA